MICSSRSFREDLYGLARVVRWELHDLHDLAHVSCVGSVLHRHRPSTTYLITADTGCLLYMVRTAVDDPDLPKV